MSFLSRNWGFICKIDPSIQKEVHCKTNKFCNEMHKIISFRVDEPCPFKKNTGLAPLKTVNFSF